MHGDHRFHIHNFTVNPIERMRSSVLRSFLSASILILVASVGFLGLLAPKASRAQSFSFCTLYQHSPQTEDARSTLGEKWDAGTGSWNSLDRSIVSYNGGNPTEVSFQERTQAGAWRDTARAQGTFDGSDRISQCTFQERKSGTLVNSIRTDYSYNSNGHLDVKTTQVWDTTNANPNGTWVNATRSTYSYDGSGNVTRRVDESWNRDNEEWRNLTRVQNTYDSSDRLTKRLVESSDGSGGWLKSRRTQKSYGSEGITKSLHETWDQIAASWEKSQRTQYSYPNSDTREEVDQTWDGNSSTWVNDEKRTITLDSNEHPVTETTKKWDGSQWKNSSRLETSYTTHNGTQKIERELKQTWTASSSDWTNSRRTTYSYTDVIPVELASFRAARAAESTVRLRWQTASETDNAGFDVQHRPPNTSTWKSLGFVESHASGGTTAEAQTYQFAAEDLSVGMHQFRLKQVDLDGSTSLIDPVTVELTMRDPLRLSAPTPNPVSHASRLSFAVKEKTQATITIYNTLGQRVQVLYEGTPSTGQSQPLHLNARELPSGTYFIRLEAGGNIRTQRVTVVQ